MGSVRSMGGSLHTVDAVAVAAPMGGSLPAYGFRGGGGDAAAATGAGAAVGHGNDASDARWSAAPTKEDDMTGFCSALVFVECVNNRHVEPLARYTHRSATQAQLAHPPRTHSATRQKQRPERHPDTYTPHFHAVLYARTITQALRPRMRSLLMRNDGSTRTVGWGPGPRVSSSTPPMS